MTKLTLADLPIEVLLDNLLPFVHVPDLLRLTCCNKLFSLLCSDDTLWKTKVTQDFNFSGQGTARTSGWKFIYRGLFKPRVFVWGDKGNGRLGRHQISAKSSGVPYPVQVSIPGVRVVSLVAGGMSFHALDSEGTVHVWGTLNGSWAAENQGFANVAKSARTPHRLILPASIRSISCGRLHSSCLDSKSQVWTFTNWGRPFWLSSPILRDPEFSPKQIECGWTFSSMLTKSGDVFVWWPFAGSMGDEIERRMNEMDSEGDKKVYATADFAIPCIAWAMDIMPTRLPPIPPLPELKSTGNDINDRLKPTVLVQIAAFDNHIIGLTNYGHVLKFGALHDETGVPHGRWEYLPRFSDIEKITEQPIFSESNDGGKLEAPRTMQITHISANFRHFVAYSTGTSSIVLVGDTDTKPDSQPKIIPELQNRAIISVTIGDYHSAALTANGKLLTWGAYSNGALGLGDPVKLEPGTPGGYRDERDRLNAAGHRRSIPPPVETPTEVRFDHQCKKRKDRFCFATTAAGWHTGALVIDLDEDDGEEEELLPTPSHPDSAPPLPPVVPLPGIFRIGHAGRGLGRRTWRGQHNSGDPS